MNSKIDQRVWRRRMMAVALMGTCFQFGFLGRLNNQFIGCTRYFDPCGTILANCAPGDFVTNAAEVGDFCVDPTCIIPGACSDDQVLGTLTNICP